MTSDPLGVSLVVPNYNGRELLERNVPTLLAAAEAYPGACEVVVVDDGSRDESVTYLRDALPAVRVLEHAQNQGFGAACKTGVAGAGHPVAILLNSDVRVAEDFVLPLARYFGPERDTFSVSPLILDRHGQPGKITVNRPYLRRGELRWRGVEPGALLKLAQLPLEQPLAIKSLFGLGGAVALWRARFLDLGGFDPLYAPFYHEDVDLGLMAWRRGWKVFVEPRSQVTHEDGGTINRHFDPFHVKVARRSHRILCGWKHADGSWRRLQALSSLLRLLTRWLRLDWRHYAAYRAAWRRRAQARAAHAKELREGKRPLLEAFAEINAAWPPPGLEP